MARERPLRRRDLALDALEVAPRLLGAVLVCGDRAARIVEVEAYRGADDPASHAYRGPTARNATMFGPAGHLYVYRSYGIHWCANVVCGPDGVASAVLVRAAAPLRGLDAMRSDRPAARTDRDLCRGPGRLCQALGIVGDHDGADLLDPASPVRLVTDGWRPIDPPVAGPRIGISRAVEHPWRFRLSGDPHVSAFRAAPAGTRDAARDTDR